jgi:hypothetical protein
VLRLEHDPEKPAAGLDPVVDAGFPKGSCAVKVLAPGLRDGDAAAAASPNFAVRGLDHDRF